LLEEPTAREPRVFANADGHDLARCYAIFDFNFLFLFWGLQTTPNKKHMLFSANSIIVFIMNP
jgi:hypothetical protein